MNATSTTTSPPANVSNGELVRWAFEMLNRHDVAPLRQFWTSDTVERFPDRVCRGPDEIARYFEDAFAAIADFHMQVLAIAEQGNDVFIHWRLTGTHAGPLGGFAATNHPLSIDGMDHFVIRAGKGRVQRGGLRSDGVRAPNRRPAPRALICRQGDQAGVQRSHEARGEAQATAWSCQVSLMPFSAWVPRSENSIPEPATRSFTVRETSTSPG